MDPNRAKLPISPKQFSEYRNYKEYQQSKQYVLDMAEDPEELITLTIDDLLRFYSYVEKIYQLRDIYRRKYFTPQEWDLGHEKFFTYLIQVMDIYRDTLKIKFKEELSRQIQYKQRPLVQSTESSEEESSIDINEFGKTIQNIDKRIQTHIEEEVEIWNSTIPSLIQDRRQALNERRRLFNEFRRIFISILPESISSFGLDDSDVINAINYVNDIMVNRKRSPSSRLFESKKKRENINTTLNLTPDEFIIQSDIFKDIRLVEQLLDFVEKMIIPNPILVSSLISEIKEFKSAKYIKGLDVKTLEEQITMLMENLPLESREKMLNNFERATRYKQRLQARNKRY